MVTKNVFRGGHLEFSNLSGNRWSDVMVPAIFEISVPKKPIGQSFMLSSQSARQFHQSAPLGYIWGMEATQLDQKLIFAQLKSIPFLHSSPSMQPPMGI